MLTSYRQNTWDYDNDIVTANVMDRAKTVIIVDDHIDLVTMLKSILVAEGYSVLSAYSGFDLFKLLEHRIPDLILLDIMMPEMDGFEVLQRLKDNPVTSSIPVIFLTAKIASEDISRGYGLGADHYITKPFTRVQLKSAIESLLAKIPQR